MRWALIVATLGRTIEVDRLLMSLSLQAGRPRVILVDQNQDGRLDALAARWTSSLDLHHECIPPRGVSQARNAGLALLRDEDLIAFPDDDCIYEPDTLATAASLLASQPNALGVIGAWYHLEDPLPSLSSSATHRVGRFRALYRTPTYAYFLRRTAVEAAGQFDESLGPGGGTPWLCGEDADFLLRAGGLSNSLIRCDRIRIQHPRVDGSVPGFQDKAFGYGRGRIRVLRKHGYPAWFQLASILHPLLGCVFTTNAARSFRWHLFRGRLHEWLRPYSIAQPTSTGCRPH